MLTATDYIPTDPDREEEAKRLAMIANRNRKALNAYDRRKGGRSRYA